MKTGRKYALWVPGARRATRSLIICLLLFLIGVISIQTSAEDFYKAEPSNQAQPDFNSVLQRVRRAYTSQIGIREMQPNRGPQVEKYLLYVNLPKGNPWCAAFVCWAYGQAGVANPRSGWSPDLFKSNKVIWARQDKKLKAKKSDFSELIRPNAQSINRSKQPVAGDIFGIYFPEKGRIAHAGFIDQWNDPWLITVEGNTNASGSREGDGVYRKRRLVRSIYKVARYIDRSNLNEP